MTIDRIIDRLFRSLCVHHDTELESWYKSGLDWMCEFEHLINTKTSDEKDIESFEATQELAA